MGFARFISNPTSLAPCPGVPSPVRSGSWVRRGRMLQGWVWPAPLPGRVEPVAAVLAGSFSFLPCCRHGVLVASRSLERQSRSSCGRKTASQNSSGALRSRCPRRLQPFRRLWRVIVLILRQKPRLLSLLQGPLFTSLIPTALLPLRACGFPAAAQVPG